MEWNREKINSSSQVVSVAEIKSHFSEYVSKVAYAGKKYVIAKRGKPLAAIVSIEDLESIRDKQEYGKISDIIGKWKNFEEIEGEINKAYSSRKKDRSRDVSF